MIKKKQRWRCKEYTDWVKSLPSCVSMRPADDPHHIINVLPGIGGDKPDDIFTIPVTRDEHNEVHHKGGRQWEELTGISQAVETVRTIELALSLGLIEIRWIG